MKYFAILKDSVREAIDNKVIFVTIGLSLLVTLFVLSLGFEPLPPEKVMESVQRGQVIRLDDMQGGGGMHARRERLPDDKIGQFVVDRVETVSGTPGSPQSAYRFTLSQRLATKEEADNVRADPAGRIALLRSRLRIAEQVHLFKVTDVRLAGGTPKGDGTTASFTVTTEPLADSRLAWGHQYSMFWGAVDLGGGSPLGIILFISSAMFLWIGSLVTLLVSVIITAFFIPNMLRKGTIDLLLVRPVSRWALLVYKYIGGLTFILVNTTVAVVGMWLALGLRSGVWANAFLLMIFVYTFFFAILYAVSTLFAVLTRSVIVAIMVTFGAWFVLFLVGLLYGLGEQRRMIEERNRVPVAERVSDNAFFQVVRAVHFVLPRTSDLDSLGSEALLYDFLPRDLIGEAMRAQQQTQRRPFNWTESITVSLAFIAVMLGLSCWRFATKDY
jgi:ABC-type transport system involved in multi-copper enzyme maturation permease subunit